MPEFANRPRARAFAAAAALLALCGLAWTASPARASAGQRTMFDDPRLLVNADESRRQATLDQLQALGVDEVRAIIYWRDIAKSPNQNTVPSPPLYTDVAMGPWECLAKDAADRGMSVQFTVSGPIPDWASSTHSSVNNPKPSLYRDLLNRLGQQFNGTSLGQCGLDPAVHHWGLYNEPNVAFFLGPQFRNGKPYSPRLYRRLYLAGRQGLLDAGHAGDRILFGETGPRGSSRAISPLRFLKLSLCLDRNYQLQGGCGKVQTSGWAQHPYSFRQAPWQPGASGDFTFGSLGRLVTALNRAGQAGAIPKRRPVFLTEYGIQSKPDPYSGVSLATQAEWLAISEFIAFGNPRIRSYAQYLMRDDPPFNSGVKYGGFETGLRFHNGDRKPALAEFRIPLVVKRRGSTKVRLWGHVRPYDGTPPQATEVRIRVKNGSGQSHFLKAPDLSASGYFSTPAGFRSGRRWKATWNSGTTTYAGPWTRAYRF